MSHDSDAYIAAMVKKAQAAQRIRAQATLEQALRLLLSDVAPGLLFKVPKAAIKAATAAALAADHDRRSKAKPIKWQPTTTADPAFSAFMRNTLPGVNSVRIGQ